MIVMQIRVTVVSRTTPEGPVKYLYATQREKMTPLAFTHTVEHANRTRHPFLSKTLRDGTGDTHVLNRVEIVLNKDVYVWACPYVPENTEFNRDSHLSGKCSLVCISFQPLVLAVTCLLPRLWVAD